MLNNNGKSEQPCLVPDLRGNVFQFFIIGNNVCCRLIIYGFYCVEVGSFCAHFLKSFYHKCVLNFVKGFFCIYWDYHIFQFVIMVYHINFVYRILASFR